VTFLPDRMEQNARVEAMVGAVSKGIRRTLDFTAGSASLTITGVDSPTGEKVTLTFDVDLTVLAGTGLDVSGGALVVDPEEFTASMAGLGLAANGDALDVTVDASSIEINSDTLRVKAAGITDAMLASTARPRIIQVAVTAPATAVTTGDAQAEFRINSLLNGLNLTACAAHVATVSSSGLPTVQIRNVTQAADMLTTRITIDVSEHDSSTAAAAAVIDTGNDDVATGDLIAIDVDVAGTGTKGLLVDLTFS
jgi:hypothetical protein